MKEECVGSRTLYGEGGDGGDEAKLRGDDWHAVVREGEGVQQRKGAQGRRQGQQLVVVHAQLHLPPAQATGWPTAKTLICCCRLLRGSENDIECVDATCTATLTQPEPLPRLSSTSYVSRITPGLDWCFEKQTQK
jgi:hypothetical protein